MTARRTRAPRVAIATCAVGTAAVLAACQAESSIIAPHNPAPLVTIVTADFASAEIAGHIYGSALERAEYRVRTVPLVGDTGEALRLVEDSEATFTVGFTGDLMRRFDPGADATAADDVYETVVGSLPEGLTAGDASSAEDKQVYVISENTSETLELETLSDMAERCPELTLGARQEVLDDRQLSQAVGELYDCTFARRQALPTDPRLVVESIRSGEVSVGVLQSADPALEAADLVVLEDDQDAVTAQQLVPVFRKGSLTESQLELVNRISGELTTDDVRELVRGTEFGTASAVALANFWLDHADL